MTYSYKNVYIKDTSVIAGMYEGNGPLKKYFDYVYDKDLYFGEKSWEKAEIRLLCDSVNKLLGKVHFKDSDVDLLISSDLQNQIASSDYMAREFDISFLGVYNACASSGEGIIIGASFLESKMIKNCIVSVVSHNMAAEKQYRNPTEYGAPKPKTATFTVTGGASLMLTNKKSSVRVVSATVGKVVDLGVRDVNHMGAVMAPPAANTIYRHLKYFNQKVSDYDMILTGDLGSYGEKILVSYMKKQYGIDISDVYHDCGTMVYDINKQPVFAGGSGCACGALVVYSYIYNLLKSKKLKRVLFVPTGALFNPVMIYQKESIPAIAHAVCLEACDL